MTELFDRIGPLADFVAFLGHPSVPAGIGVAAGVALLLASLVALALGRPAAPGRFSARWPVAGGLAAVALGLLLGLEPAGVARGPGRVPSDGHRDAAAGRMVDDAVARAREAWERRGGAQPVAALAEAYGALSNGPDRGARPNGGGAPEVAALAGDGGRAGAALGAGEAQAGGGAPQPAARREPAAAGRGVAALAAPDDAAPALSASRRAVRLDPDDAAGWLGLGEMLAQAGDAAEAEHTFTQAVAVAGAADPMAMVALGRRGDLRMARGSLAAAEADYRGAAAIARDLAEREPDSPERRRDLSLSLERIGDLLAAQGDATGALEAYREALDLRRGLAERGPGGGPAAARREVASGHTKIGDLLAAQGDPAAALAAYHEALRLAGPADGAVGDDGASWRREVRVAAHGRIGDVLAAAGDANGALEARRAAVRAAEELVAAGADGPADPTRQRTLAGALDRLGATLAERGDRAGALAALRRGLAAIERLAARRPDDAGAQTEAVAAYWRLAQFLADDPAARAEAAALLAKGLAVLGRLQGESRLTAAQADWIDLFKGRHSELLEFAADGSGEGAALDNGAAGPGTNGSATAPANGPRVVR